MSPALSPSYDPRLIEEAVFLAQRSVGEPSNVREERERIYETSDPEERERLFTQLNRACFTRLGLSGPLEQALHEQPAISLDVQSCYAVCAAQAKDEGAELFVAPEESLEARERRTVRILLRPESLLNAGTLLTFLRHELFHIADMLDPAYRYEPALPSAEVGPAYDQLLTNRYRLLWDITIDGRMSRRGWIPQTARAEHLASFHAAFPALQNQTDELFAAFFDRAAPTHGELVAFALNPRAASSANEPSAGNRCPLCGFPTHSFEPHPEQLAADTLAVIRQDFPHWQPSAGICRQCADLYRAHHMSMEAARLIAGAAPHSRNPLQS